MNATLNYPHTIKNDPIHQHAQMKSHINFFIDSSGKIINKNVYSIQWVDFALYLSFILTLFIIPLPVHHATAKYSKIVAPVNNNSVPTSVVGYLKSKAPKANQAYLTSIVKSAHDVSRELKMDKNLLLAVMSIESNFDQYAMSEKGAMCLMQIMPNWHAVLLKSKFTKLDKRNIYDVDVCVHSGGKILADYIAEQKSVELGLLRYNGSLKDKTKVYSNKVLAEKRILDQLEKV